MVLSVDRSEEFDALICGEKPVIAAFTARTTPCKQIAPYFESLAGREDCQAITFVEVDVDAAEDIAKKYYIRAMPTYMVFRHGEAIDTLRGANVTALDNLVRAHIPTA